MLNLLPAVLVGGPPHAGKSVLFYRLTQALRAAGVDHYALRACPDGEGNWFYEGQPELVGTLRVKLSGTWPDSFIQSISQALADRCLPFLVDMGGRPTASQECLLHGCTHAILLLREDRPADTGFWQRLVEKYSLLPFARLISRPSGDPVITDRSSTLRGVLSGLERSVARSEDASDLFKELLTRIQALFTSYDLQEVRACNLNHAPTELTLDVQQELRVFTTISAFWEPAMLLPLLARLPEQVPLSVYGPGPGWLYAALAAYVDPQPFYLFDPKLPIGWISPAGVLLGTEIVQAADMHLEMTATREATFLKMSFPHDRLEYLRPDPLLFPLIPPERGLVIDGRVPNWLLTALVRLYKAVGIPWIATFFPPLGQAVVVYSRNEALPPGALVDGADGELIRRE
ncbi:MAG TPA: CRISPR-associated protein Csx3 [Ktedonobacteraceae bacterium]|jgi:CRISPR-associated protein Csx3